MNYAVKSIADTWSGMHGKFSSASDKRELEWWHLMSTLHDCFGRNQSQSRIPAQAARDILQEACSKAPLALLNAKAAVDEGQDAGLATGLAFERAYYSRLFHTQDRLEGLAAFNERRAPIWQCK